MQAPNKLGKYEIRRELGKGAMGIVYEGFDPLIERRVALKTIRKELLDAAEAQEILARFKREAQAAGRLTHPGIVAIYEYGEEGDTAFIAMEYVEGKELKEHFDSGDRFQLKDVVRIMGQLLGALDFSHARGVVHRDIKPANVILMPDGSIKVADFGIARVESSSLTQAGTVLGTPSYMSPEQFMGQTVDGRSDLFSAGVILYQFLTGERPFTGASATTIMHKVLKEEPAAPSELNVQLPQALDAVVKRAMAKRPADRYQTGREFAEALKAAAESKAVVEATVIAGALEATRVNAPPAPEAPSGRPAKKSTAVLAVAAVVVLAAVGAARYFMFGKAPEPAPPAPAVATAPAEPVAMKSAPVQPAPVPAAAAPAEPAGARDTMLITAVGLADPGDPKYASDPGLAQAEARADSRRQLVEKAVALYVDGKSMTQHYGALQSKLLDRGGEFIKSVVQEGQPAVGKDGLLHVVTKAELNVKDVQKSLNQMSKEERIQFIRNQGDPKISVAITLRDADKAEAPAGPSPVAENIVKERIKAFGFRVWSEDAAKTADFAIVGEAKFKKLSHRLEASGIVIEKVVLTSWTVKCLDRQSGEEIYYNTKIPEKVSWNDKDAALRDIGKLIGDEFSKDFFLQHFAMSGQHARMKLEGLPSKDAAEQVLGEVTGLRQVLSASLATSGGAAVYELELSGGMGSVSDLVAQAVLKPLNAKLGKQCFNVATSAGAEVSVSFEKACTDPAVLGRFDTLPPAALLAAPPARQKSVVKSPEVLKKLSI